MDLLELRSRVYSQIRDHDRVFIEAGDVDDWLNEAYVDLASRLDVIEFEVQGLTTGNPSLPFPDVESFPEVLRPMILRLGTEDVEFVDSDTFYAWADVGAIPAHTIAYIFNNVILLHPNPEADIDFVFRYSSSPEPLVNDTDEPLVPSYMQTKMVRYAQAQAWYKTDEITRGDRALASYEQGLPPVPGGRDKTIPGPVTLMMEPGPFDVDSDSVHI